MSRQFIKILIKRLLTSLLVLFLMITVLFILLRISPGDPTQKFISPELSTELAAKVKDAFELNNSILAQYKSFLMNLARGDLGISYTYREPVLKVISEYLPFTLVFSFISFVFEILIGSVLAFIAVRKKNSRIDHVLTKFNLILFSVPTFVIGVFLILIFSDWLNWLPSAGLWSFDFYYFSFPQKLFDYITHLILPVITLSMGGAAVFYRYLRDNLEENINQQFVLNLKANGFDESTIFFKHILPNSIGPVIAVAGVELGMLLSGALITEVIFSLPGMGRLTVNAILQRDYPLIIGCTLVASVLVILSNLSADLIRAKIDKRLANQILN